MAEQSRGDALCVHVRLFGAFRRYFPHELTLELPRGVEVSALRRRIGEALRGLCPDFRDDALLAASVVADERRVLCDGDRIEGALDCVSVAVLPPVCGG